MELGRNLGSSLPARRRVVSSYSDTIRRAVNTAIVFCSISLSLPLSQVWESAASSESAFHKYRSMKKLIKQNEIRGTYALGLRRVPTRGGQLFLRRGRDVG